MNTQTPETDAFLQRHRQHAEDEMETTIEFLKEMELERNGLRKRLSAIQSAYGAFFAEVLGNRMCDHAKPDKSCPCCVATDNLHEAVMEGAMKPQQRPETSKPTNLTGAAESRSVAPTCSPLDWRPITEAPPEKFGWYAAAVNPVNADEVDAKGINSWRKKFGFTKVWYNADSIGKWWEPDPHGQRSRPIGHRMTHWAELPPVPLIPENTEVRHGAKETRPQSRPQWPDRTDKPDK